MQQIHTKNNKYIALSFIVSLAWLLQPMAFAQSDQEIAGIARVCQQVPEEDARLACYDRILPPTNGTTSAGSNRNNNSSTRATPPGQSGASTAASSTVQTSEPEREESRGLSSVVPFFNQSDDVVVRIVAVEELSISSARVTAEDGTVFLQRNATTRTRWPEPPFDVEVQRGAFGTIYLWMEDSRQRVRVVVEN